MPHEALPTTEEPHEDRVTLPLLPVVKRVVSRLASSEVSSTASFVYCNPPFTNPLPLPQSESHETAVEDEAVVAVEDEDVPLTGTLRPTECESNKLHGSCHTSHLTIL